MSLIVSLIVLNYVYCFVPYKKEGRSLIASWLLIIQKSKKKVRKTKTVVLFYKLLQNANFFLIRYRVFTSQTWRELKEHGKALDAVIPNLLPKTKYEVEVAAVTSAGLGPFTRRSAITAERPGNTLALVIL